MSLGKRIITAAACAVAALTSVPANAQMSDANMRKMLTSWPASAQKAAADMMAKYGRPQEATATMLKWHNNGPWKYTMISNYETPHSFPASHPDVMEQGINYRVPEGKFDDLAMYDGSVTADRTQGHLAARCDMEAANFLAVNLANDVATGRRNVAGARTYYARAIDGFKKTGKMDPYMQRLQFQPRMQTGDKDTPAKMSMARR